MAPKTEDFLVNDTRFWVVRPRISGANVTGLGTLISGAYIGVEIGTSKAKRRDFVALETPPVVTGETPGRFFWLKTPDLGSLDTGTPIYFRRLQVGQVASYELDNDGHFITVEVFVRAPYDQYVNPDTRFWHASGIDVSLTASGLKVQTQSATLDLDRRRRLRNPCDRSARTAGRGQHRSSPYMLTGPRPSSQPRKTRRPTSSSSKIRFADWNRAHQSSFAAFRWAKWRKFARRLIIRLSSFRCR